MPNRPASSRRKPIPLALDHKFKPWDRQPRETLTAYATFQAFLAQGTARNLNALARSIHRCQTTINRRAKLYRWQERALAWDHAQAALVEAAERRSLEARGRLWADRVVALREKEFALGEKLLAKAQAMIAFPLTVTRREARGGRSVLITEPAEWNFGTVARLAEVGSELTRRGAGLPMAALTPAGEDEGSAARPREIHLTIIAPREAMKSVEGARVIDLTKASLLSPATTPEGGNGNGQHGADADDHGNGNGNGEVTPQ
jgi:hypothetical protein